MKEKITITNVDGVKEEVELVNVVPVNDHFYLIYRPLDSQIVDDNVELFISRLEEENGEMKLKEIDDDKEYEDVCKYIENIDK